MLRKKLQKLEFEYAKKKFLFEMRWARELKRLGPKTLKDLIREVQSKIDALDAEHAAEETKRKNHIYQLRKKNMTRYKFKI